MFNRSWTQLQQILLLLGDEAASFNDLLVVFQNMTMQISSQVNDSLVRYSLAVAQYDDLVTTLNQTRLPQVRQIQVDLSNLRRISTTVLVLASTSEELMNRTITDFVNTQQVVLEIRAISLNITQIVNNIEEEYAIVSAIRRDIRRRREDLSFQVAELEALVGDALNYSETAVSTMYRVQNITTVIQNKSDNIEIVYGHLSSTIHSFEMDITRLVDAILILANQIQQQLTGLPDYGPLQDDINNLSINASGLENHTALDILPEIDNQLNEYTKINRTLALNIERFNKLETNLSTLAYKSNSSVRNLTSLETETKQDIVDALSTVDRAQGVLVKLQNFSNSSQTIVDSTFQAAEDVQDVEMEAAEIMKMVTNITEHVQLAQADVQNASQITVDAQNVTNEAKQVNLIKWACIMGIMHKGAWCIFS